MAVTYAEAAYFDGNQCAHCAARDEANRLARIQAQGRRYVERRTGCTGTASIWR